MAITVDELVARIYAEAARRHISAEELLDSLSAQQPDEPKPTGRFAFAGMGRSGRGDLSERHKEIREELIADQRASGE